MSSVRSEKGFARIFFDILNGTGVDYAVVRNYETLPEKVPGSDIDILIRAGDYGRVRNAVAKGAADSGYRVWKSYRKNFDIVQMSYAPVDCDDPGDVLRVDLFLGGVKWKGRDILEPELLWKHVVEHRGIRVLDEPFSTALTLLNSLVFGSGIKERYVKGLKALDNGKRAAVREIFAETFGQSGPVLYETIERARKGLDPEEFDTEEIRRCFLRSRARGLGDAFSNLLSVVRTTACRTLSPPGFFVVLIGPDGCGKSTVNELMQSRCASLFSGVEAFHLFPKPGVFSILDRRSLKRWEKKHRGKEEWELRKAKSPAWRSVVRALYLLFRFWAGYAIWIYPRLVRGRLVIGERWRYDLLFDPASKGVDLPYPIRKVLYTVSPSPDMAIVLSGSAAKMAERKKEIPESEIARQLEVMARELGGSKRVVFADSTTDVEETFRTVLRSVVLP